MLMLLFLLAFPIFLLYLLQKCKTNRKKFRLPPGPQGLPLVGNLHELAKSTPHLYMWQQSQKYGPLMSLRLGFVPTIVISSDKMAKEIMKTHDLVFCSRPSMTGQQRLSYNGLDMAFAPYNDYWREMRKICVLNLFSSKQLQNFRPIREDEVCRMIKKISEATEASKPTNLSEAVMAFTSTLICRVAFSKRYEDGGSERSRFHSLLNEAQAMMAILFYSDYFPYTKWIDKLTGLTGRLERNFKELDTFYQEIIDEHLNPNRPKSEQVEDFIDVMLRIKRESLFTTDLTLDHIKGVLMNVFIAATDTSAATLVWAMTLLMKNTKAMNKVQQEIRNLVGKKKFVNEDDILKLPYFKAVVKETMRLQPPAPLLVPRESMQDCDINGYDIPTKTLVYINAWAIGRDPDTWNNPERFYPERFLDVSSIDFKGNDFGLIPFGAGRRVCPGMQMGVVNLELALANLLFKFDWEMPPGLKVEDIDMDGIPGITIHKKNALYLMPRKYT